MLLVQNTRVQNLTSRGANEVHAKVISILELHLRKAEVGVVAEDVGGVVAAELAEALDVAWATGNDVHWSLGVLHAVWIGVVLIDGVEALRVVDVAEDADVDAVLVEEVFEGGLAGVADVAAAGGVPLDIACISTLVHDE